MRCSVTEPPMPETHQLHSGSTGPAQGLIGICRQFAKDRAADTLHQVAWASFIRWRYRRMRVVVDRATLSSGAKSFDDAQLIGLSLG
jgi:hypothetical protein